MKKLTFISILTIFIFGTTDLNAQKSCCNKGIKTHSCNKKSCNKDKMVYDKTKGNKIMSFEVAGNCDMCKTRIEKAALGVKGIKTAEWNKNTKILKVTYESGVLKKELEKAIADAGHDTPDFKAPDKIYNSLPACCKYKR